MADNKLSQDYKARFGTLSVHRGQDSDDKPLFSWEPIPDCTNLECTLNEKCHYVKRDGKCHVIAKFVRSAAENIVRNYGNIMSNAVRNRIGSQLMPLYVILAKLYKAEAGMSSAVFNDNKGNPKVHPIYKDIRETIRSIDLQWKNLGLMALPIGEGEGKGLDLDNYYSNMEKRDLREVEEKRKARREFKVVPKKEVG